MGQFGSRWDNQSMSYRCACVWAMLARAKASTFSVLLLAYVDSAGMVTLVSNNFPSYQRGLRESTESSRLWREWKRAYNKAVQGLKVTMNTRGQTYTCIHSLGFNHDVKTWARVNDIVTFYFYTLSFWWHKQTLHFRRTIFTPRSWSFAKYIYTYEGIFDVKGQRATVTFPNCYRKGLENDKMIFLFALFTKSLKEPIELYCVLFPEPAF